MANELTEFYNIPKPNPAHDVKDDVIPLGVAFDMIDAALRAHALLIAAKAAADHGHDISGIAGLVDALAGKMSAARTFALSELTDVVGAADATNNYVMVKIDGQYVFRSALSVLDEHFHTIAQITGLQTALDAKAAKTDAALLGNPTAPTQAAGNNSTRIANTAFVSAAIAALVNSSPAALDTLQELAAALGNDANFATTMTAALAAKASLAGVEVLLNKTLTNPTIDGYTEGSSVFAAGSAFAPNLAADTIFYCPTNANATITLPAVEAGKSFTLVIIYGGAHTVTWAGGPRKWVGGTAPTPTSANGKIDVFSFVADDTASNWLSFPSGQNL